MVEFLGPFDGKLLAAYVKLLMQYELLMLVCASVALADLAMQVQVVHRSNVQQQAAKDESTGSRFLQNTTSCVYHIPGGRMMGLSDRI